MNEQVPSYWQLSVELPSVTHTEYFAQYLANCLIAPMVITLSGDIGAGKTTLVRALLRSWGIEGPIKSPTYSLLESYDLPYHTTQVHHFDLYRITDESELVFLGFRDYFQSHSICCIEWPERIKMSEEQIDLALLLIGSGNGRTLYLQANDKILPLLRQCVQTFKTEAAIINTKW